MKFGIHNSSWVFGSDPAEAFEGVRAKAQWAENNGFTWFSVMDHLIEIPPWARQTSRLWRDGRSCRHGRRDQPHPPRNARVAVAYRNPAHLA